MTERIVFSKNVDRYIPVYLQRVLLHLAVLNFRKHGRPDEMAEIVANLADSFKRLSEFFKGKELEAASIFEDETLLNYLSSLNIPDNILKQILSFSIDGNCFVYVDYTRELVLVGEQAKKNYDRMQLERQAQDN